MGDRGWRIYLVPIQLFKSIKMLSKIFKKNPSMDLESFVSFKERMRGGWPDQLRGEDTKYLPEAIQSKYPIVM